jgi:hypothetical protein
VTVLYVGHGNYDLSPFAFGFSLSNKLMLYPSWMCVLLVLGWQKNDETDPEERNQRFVDRGDTHPNANEVRATRTLFFRGSGETTRRSEDVQTLKISRFSVWTPYAYSKAITNPLFNCNYAVLDCDYNSFHLPHFFESIATTLFYGATTTISMMENWFPWGSMVTIDPHPPGVLALQGVNTPTYPPKTPLGPALGLIFMGDNILPKNL